MINKLINEICKALDTGLYLVALDSALTLPDICGCAEYPQDRTGDRYKKWYSNYVKNFDVPADIVYKLRCSLLHQGDVLPKCKKGIKFRLKTNTFTQSWGIDFCVSSSATHADGTSEQIYDIDVGFLCTMLCKVAREYYADNKQKFSFLNLEIVDIKDIFFPPHTK